MPIRHAIVHLIDKKPDGQPATLHARDAELADSQAIENLLADLNDSYNAKPNKAWGLFHEESGAYPFSGWLSAYLEGKDDFVAFSRQAVEHLKGLMEIPADKRTLNQFRRFTGRAEGLSISFEAHLLGSRINFDEERGVLVINELPAQLRDQLRRHS